MGGVIYITKAVSDYDGEAIFFIHTGQKNSGLSSLYDMNNIGYKTKSEQRSIPVLKIDTFSENQNITSIDFMKIDVEGNELNVLKGAEKMFKNNKIKIVQFEFGHAARASRTLLLDFFNFFDKYNFEIFTVMPYGLNRIKYTPFEENRWHIINFVAIRKDLVDKFNPLIRKE